MEAGKAESCFVEKRSREDMDPGCHGGAVSGLKWLVHERAGTASEIIQGDIVATVSKLIVSAVVIHTFVILVSACGVGRSHIGVRDIGNTIEGLCSTNLLALGNID